MPCYANYTSFRVIELEMTKIVKVLPLCRGRCRKINATTICCQYNAANGNGRRSSPSSLLKATQSVSSNVNKNGIGILEFLRGKSYFITGGTGFLGKAVIEKLLRADAEVGKIYVLIKADTKEAATNRLKTEVIDSDIFKCLRLIHGKLYEDFMLSKVVAVAGNVSESNLGMDRTLMYEIAEEVDVIINSEANTAIDERYDVAFNINTTGPCRVLNFARTCQKVSVFLHVSSAFVNGERKGDVICSTPSHPMLDIVDHEMKMACDSSIVFQENERTHKMRQMGLKRARHFGWRNVYEFTKAMGEMLLKENQEEEIPIVIIRPSIIGSSYKEPYPGWIHRNRMGDDPFILAYEKGYLIKPEAMVDIIPVDMVVNAIIATMAKHGGFAREPNFTVYNVVSSEVNPLMCCEVFNFYYEHLVSYPLTDTIDIKRMKFVNSKEELEAIYVGNETAVDQTTHYNHYVSAKSWCDADNTEKLWEAMSEEEKNSFGFDVKSIDWKDYFIFQV